MVKSRILLVFFLVTMALAGCKKDKYDADKQMAIDDALIVNYLAKNNIVAVKHSSGIYYEIIKPGSGSIVYNSTTKITADYTGVLLDGTVFDSTYGKSPATFTLGGVVAGWQVGIPLIQKGGEIRLIIPSVLAYQNTSSGAVPANAVLDFKIQLVNVQ